MNIHSTDHHIEQTMLANRATCKNCRGQIVWVTTSSGKSMPVDASPVSDGELFYLGGDVDKGKAVAYRDRFSDQANSKNPGKYKGYRRHVCPKRAPGWSYGLNTGVL